MSSTRRWSIHHLSAREAVVLLREMGRVARLGVVVNDLDRTRLGWIGAWLIGHLLTRNRYTRHDAPLSVLRSYRADETRALLRTAGLTPVRTVRGSFGQRYAIAAVPTPRRCGATGRRLRIRREPANDGERSAGRWPRRAGRDRDRRWRPGRGGPGCPTGRERAARSSSWSDRPPGRWRAGGVFTSPAAVAALRRAGLDAATLAAVARPIPAMRVETRSGTTFRLTYGTETGGEPAVGFDRSPARPGAPRSGGRARAPTSGAAGT